VSATERNHQPILDAHTRDAVRTHLRIASCYNLLMREARQIVACRWNLTLPQFDMLAELARHQDGPGLAFVELSRLLSVTSGNLTGIADRLEQRCLVERRMDEHDRRVIRVLLTDHGRRLADEVLAAHAADLDEILSFMPLSALAELSELLGRVRDGLETRAERTRAATARTRQQPHQVR
jgi:DNA-binding MarR family transcriptional regulator